MKSLTELLDALAVKLPDKEELDMSIFIADFHVMQMLLNLAWFLAYQMILRRLIRAALITILHCRDQDWSQIFQMSSIDWNWRALSIEVANQDHIFTAKGHWKNKWKEVSEFMKQREHIEGMQEPLYMRFSSAGTFSCINLHTNMDLEGGMSKHQIVLA